MEAISELETVIVFGFGRGHIFIIISQSCLQAYGRPSPDGPMLTLSVLVSDRLRVSMYGIEGRCNSNGNILPSRNILPNGRVHNNEKGISKGDNRTGYVLGLGNGHGSVIKGNGKVEVTGNIQIAGETIMLKHALSSTNPEDVKNVGNDQYKKGHFAKALSLYDRAITLSPRHASYRSNKGVALIGLRRLAEAVQECQEAIRFNHFYARAHHRLASLYIRIVHEKFGHIFHHFMYIHLKCGYG
eukprot:Gb_40173 [translate_table: standard]